MNTQNGALRAIPRPSLFLFHPPKIYKLLYFWDDRVTVKCSTTTGPPRPTGKKKLDMPVKSYLEEKSGRNRSAITDWRHDEIEKNRRLSYYEFSLFLDGQECVGHPRGNHNALYCSWNILGGKNGRTTDSPQPCMLLYVTSISREGWSTLVPAELWSQYCRSSRSRWCSSACPWSSCRTSWCCILCDRWGSSPAGWLDRCLSRQTCSLPFNQPLTFHFMVKK